MTATEFFQAGRLQAAIDAQIQVVRANPTDYGKRIFLFELLAYAGDWDRARKQIDVVTCDELELTATLETYKKLLDAEDHRRRVFKDGVLPSFLLPTAPDWVYPRLQAVAALAAGQPAEAAALIAQSDAAAAPVSLVLNKKPVEGFRDCDDLFGPVLEVFAKSGYYWLPLDQVESLAAMPPKYPRDLVWLPVNLEVKDGPAGEAFLPCRYPATTETTDDALKLSRATDWKQADGGPTLGLGLRMFLAGDDAVPITELRELVRAG